MSNIGNVVMYIFGGFFFVLVFFIIFKHPDVTNTLAKDTFDFGTAFTRAVTG
jgi:hypothetical protein